VAKATGKAYEAIRSRILNGDFPPKFHLREEEVSEQIGVSRTPVREALRKLAADGYVQFMPNRGAFVAEWSERSISDLIEVRAELAAMAGGMAARRIREEDLDALTKLNRTMADIAKRKPVGYLTEVSGLNLEFHNIIFKAADNNWLYTLLQQTAYLPMVQRAQYGFQEIDWRRVFDRYDELIRALKVGDGKWAAAALRSQFHASLNAVRRTAELKNDPPQHSSTARTRRRATGKRKHQG
jgi:DNA-binding GntR family transcriptional regulator